MAFARFNRIVRLARVGWLVVAMVLVAACDSTGGSSTSPDPRLVNALKRGVNLSHWWTGPEPNPVIRSLYALGPSDFAAMRRGGFGHVRIPVDPVRVFDTERPTVLRTDAVKTLRGDIQAAVGAGLAVIVVMQMDSAAKQRLFASGGAVEAFASQWAQLAAALSEFPASGLALEVLNEPETENPWAWGRMQRGLVETIRRAAPRLSIVVTGAHYSDPTDLAMLAPLPDDNVIYSFHFYTPHNFTHQGAHWGWEMWQRMRGLPYPSSPEGVEAAIARADGGARSHIGHYGNQRWDTAKLRTRIQMVRQWASRHGLTVQCTEFGAIELAPKADRRRWLGDARRLIEEAGFGWTVWDYAGEFAVTRPGSPRKLDPSLASALGFSTAQIGPLEQ